MRGLVVAVGRGPGGARQPIQHHVGKQQIPVHRVLGQFGGRIGPLLELLHDPGQLPDRGVVQPVRQGLRPGDLDHHVAGLLGLQVLQVRQPRPLGLGQLPHLVRVDLGECGGPVHVHADDLVGIEPAEPRGDDRAGVAALRAVAVVSEPVHQLSERPGHPVGVPAGLAGRPGEPAARDRRDHQVERVRRVAAMCPGVGQRTDDVQELHDRAGPAVDQDQRQRVRLARAHVQEVDVLPVDLGGELRVLVQLPLVGAPVVAIAPVLRQPLEVVHRHPATPADIGQVRGPPGPVEPVPQVVQVSLGNVDGERPDLAVVLHTDNPRSRLGQIRS